MAEFSTGPWQRTGSNIYAPAGEGDISVHYDVAHVNNIQDEEGKAPQGDYDDQEDTELAHGRALAEYPEVLK